MKSALFNFFLLFTIQISTSFIILPLFFDTSLFNYQLRMSSNGGHLTRGQSRSSVNSTVSSTSNYYDAQERPLSSNSNVNLNSYPYEKSNVQTNSDVNSSKIMDPIASTNTQLNKIQNDSVKSDTELREYVIAQRLKNSEVINNKPNLNPLQAAFSYMDGSISINDTVKLISSNLKNLVITNKNQFEDSGTKESVDYDQMKSINKLIKQLDKVENLNVNNPSKTSMDNHLVHDLVESIRSEFHEEIDTENKINENIAIDYLKYENEPITLPNRNSSWKHSPLEHYYENLNLRTLNLTSNDNISLNQNFANLTNIKLEDLNHLNNAISFMNNNPQKYLDEKNDQKTAFLIDTFLLGYADMLCLTSSFVKDKNGIKKGPIMLPLLSVYFSDITEEVYFMKFKFNNNNTNTTTSNKFNALFSNQNDTQNNERRNNLSALSNDELLKLAAFSKNRIFRLHLEYGAGDHVLRWDLEKDSKHLIHFHKMLLKLSSRERQDKINPKDFSVPKFPVLPSHHKKIKDLFKYDKETKNSDHHVENQIDKNNNSNTIDENQTESNQHELVDNISDTNQEEADLQPIATPSIRRDDTNASIVSDSVNSFRSARSVTRTLTKLSSAAFINFKQSKDKKKDKNDQSDLKKTVKQKKELQLIHEKMKLNKKYRDDIQSYFNDLIKQFSFKEQSNGMLQFFELSPFSILLSNEIYRKRKEGYLFVVSSASKQGWRVSHFKFHDLSEMVKRHTQKWCVLGDSFFLYTSDIVSTTPEEVFLIDSKIKMTIQGFSKKFDINEITDDHNFNENNGENDYMNENPDYDENFNNIDFDSEMPNYMLKNSKSYPTIKLKNSERSISLLTTNPKLTLQWAMALKQIINGTEWSKPHRFDSFAPIRNNAFAQWFVDARDYWYAASSAIEMAKDVIYIHDWWLSPELYLRRPANGNQDYRIDRLLERKARQGVKIFIIIYRNVGNTVVTDSMYTKHSLLDLHENIFVLRSPNQIVQNVFFWAHHEKLLIVDNVLAFLGGIDLCFGRYDTPDHVLADDSKYAFEKTKNTDYASNSDTLFDSASPSSTNNSHNAGNTIKANEKPVNSESTPVSSEIPEKIDTPTTNDSPTTTNQYDFQQEFQIFPGKDYSNPRKKDFFELALPHDDMYDRESVPRMPWHDVHMLTSGQVARDLARHFIQRWNYLLRQKRPSRPTPLLVPPRPFTDKELEQLELKGNCEVQLLRSSGEWSLGLKEHEQSIQNAYIKCIEQSEHFVYMENQFFITSCKIDNTFVKNKIGDALVDRIITAHKNGEIWKAVIVIPLMPGFEADVDTKEGSSVRLIMQCQYMSISMGETSIFSRLRRVGIRPEDYITFFSLRKWGKIGPSQLLTTEQLYIHAKTMVVDDRIAIIGSANINERSMRGSRDSEVCAIVRDKDLVESKMDGQTYHVGKFAHSLRVRLMREHLGVDVDLIDLVERRFKEIENFCHTKEGLNASVLKANEGSQSLSAMVELGTRYLLGLSEGTVEFNKVCENDEFKETLTQSMISNFSSIQNKSDNSKSLDDLEFSFSFNHRAGVENVGIRSAKNLSSDTRIKNENHRNEVRGEYDGFNSNSYKEAKVQISRFLLEKINQIKADIDDSNNEGNWFNTKSSLLPDYEDILEVLAQKPVEQSKVNISEQNVINVDRWTMIKRLFYLKKLYSKMLLERKGDNGKGESFGTASNTSRTASDYNKSTGSSRDDEIVAEGSKSVDHTNPTNYKSASTVTGNKRVSPDQQDLSNRINENSATSSMESSSSSPFPPISSNSRKNRKLANMDIPLVQLNDENVADIDKNVLPPVDFEFIDPYGFEDPLDIKFYEGTWLTQAIRNTLLYQMIFHVQPDDSVQTWTDYKEFEKMKEAFELYQKSSRSHTFDENTSGDVDNIDNETLGESIGGESIDDVEQRRRRLERSAKLAELERYQRIGGQANNNVGKQGVYDYDSSLKLLKLIKGNIVLFPTTWLKKEVEGLNWNYKADKIPPIQIYD